MDKFRRTMSGVLAALVMVAATTGAGLSSGAGSGSPLLAAASGAPALLPTPREMEWRGSAGTLPEYIEVVTDPDTGKAIGAALDELLPRAWDPAERPLFAPAFTQSREEIPPAGKGLVAQRSFSLDHTAMLTYRFLAGLLKEKPVRPGEGIPARLILINLSQAKIEEDTSSADPSPFLQTGLAPIPVTRLQALPQEGYFLTAGYDPQLGALAVAASYSDRGLLYAALTWATLARQVQAVPVATVTDWPAYPVRGVIEGFYGPPWSPADRLNQVAFYPWVKMNTYVYAPKDDPYHREKWRDLYPDTDLQRLAELVQLANHYQVDFVFAISPGLSVVFSSDADFEKLVAKTEQLRAIGVHRFALLLDDIPKTLDSAADRVRFRNDVGAAQAFLVNRYAAYLREKEPGYPLIVVPTEYYDLATSTYKNSFAAAVASDVIVYWTGEGVLTRTLTPDQARRAISLWRHSILMWDNYPVNDYAREQLLLGPLEDRDDLSALVNQPVDGAASADHRFIGFTFNPMNEAEASKLPLATCADYAWNPAVYRPEESWQAAVTQLVPPAARDGFVLLARHYLTSALHPNDELAPEIQQILLGRLGGVEGKQAAEEFFAKLEGLAHLPVTLANDRLAGELATYIELLSLTGRLARSYYLLLDSERERGGSLPDDPEVLASEWLERADWLTWFNYWQRLGKRMGGGLDNLVRSLGRRVAEPLGFFAGNGIRPETGLGAYQSFTLEKMADGRDDTFFWSNRGPRAGDFFGLDLGRVVPVETIRLGMASTNGSYARPKDYLEHLEIRISANGDDWQTVGRFDNQPDIEVRLPAGTRARFVRVVATASQTSWVQVRELSVSPKPAAFDIELVGGQVEEAGQVGGTGVVSAARAVPVTYTHEPAGLLDGDPSTGVALRALAPTVTITITHPGTGDGEEQRVWGGLALILAATPGDSDCGSLRLEVREENGKWVTIGGQSTFVSGKTQAVVVRFREAQPFTGYRLVWQPGSPGAQVSPTLAVREFYPLPPDVAADR